MGADSRGSASAGISGASPAAAALEISGSEMREVRRLRRATVRSVPLVIRLLPRADRVAWWIAWAVSTLVIAVYLLGSLSQPAPMERVTSAESNFPDSLASLWVGMAAFAEAPLEPGPQGPRSIASHALDQWSDTLGVWQPADLDGRNSAYHEGEAVPFMLRIENAAPGTQYRVSVRFDCARQDGLGYDFLTSYDRDRGVMPALHEDGPGSSVADATLGMPDDEDMTLDDRERDRSFKLWGGSFNSGAVSPVRDGSCLDQGQTAQKTYMFTVRALADTVYLLWGGHLASSAGWGDLP